MTDRAAEIRRLSAVVLGAGEPLRAASIEHRVSWLAEAAGRLCEAASRDREDISEATGLSAPMVDWAARTTLDTVHANALLGLAEAAHARPNRPMEPLSMLSLVLAGNVFTGCVKAIVVPLLLGVPVLVKASSREAVFPAMLVDALRGADRDLARAIGLVRFEGGDRECERALVENADAVSVYGSDETVAAMAERLGDRPLFEHGHGVSVAYCGAGSLERRRLDATLRSLALDICAYDQRGCLSPQLIYVERSPLLGANGFAERLAQALGSMGATLPRGSLPLALGAEQAQWRGVAEVEGALIRGDGYAVAVRPPEPVRWSPAYRNVTVAPVRGIDEAVSCMEPIGLALKCVGADPGSVEELGQRLGRKPGLRAYACPLGTMQTPALDAPADGRPVWEGLLRPSREV